MNLDYNHIIKLINQLPKSEVSKLKIALNSKVESKKKSIPINKLILEAPIWSGTDIENYDEARSEFNNSRLK